MNKIRLGVELILRGYTMRRFPDGNGRMRAWLPPAAIVQRVPTEWHVGNLGAGVQSSDLFLRSAGIDCWIFADTMDEKRATYKHLLWLIDNGKAPVIVASRGKLSADLLRDENSTGQRFASIPAFTAPDRIDWIGPRASDEVGKMRRQCTKEYKIEVIEKTIRRLLLGLEYKQRNPKTVAVHQYFGISADESGRATKIYERSMDAGFIPHFLLLEENRDRQDCVDSLAAIVPHPIVKSACKQCPFQDDWEWAEMKANEPGEFLEACQIDDALREPGRIVNRGLNQKLYLHRSCQPLRDVDFSQAKPITPKVKQSQLFSVWGIHQECEGVCGI